LSQLKEEKRSGILNEAQLWARVGGVEKRKGEINQGKGRVREGQVQGKSGTKVSNYKLITILPHSG